MPETTPTVVTADMPVSVMLKTAGKKLLAALLNQISSGGTQVAAGGILLDILSSANGKPGMMSYAAVLGKLVAHGLADHGKNTPVV